MQLKIPVFFLSPSLLVLGSRYLNDLKPHPEIADSKLSEALPYAWPWTSKAVISEKVFGTPQINEIHPDHFWTD